MIYWTQAGEILKDHQWKTVKRRGNKYRPGGIWLDNIFALDTESTSAFLTPDGDIVTFDFGHPESYWKKCKKYGWVYIWMVGVDDVVFYGRTLAELHSFLELLDDITDHAEKIFYAHNAAWDWQFVRDAIPFDQVFARTKRKILTADCEELHFHLRCSYFLVNMSLEKWAKTEKLQAQKLVGELDYLRLRTPVGKYSTLTDTELSYCENDILVMLEGLKKYREKYLNVYRIPLTMTGETRVTLAEVMKERDYWKRRMYDLIPATLEEYRFMMAAFFGGDVHANYYLANKTLHRVWSYDFASSYPWICLARPMPITKFSRVTIDRERFMHNPNYFYIVTFVAYNIESKMHNTFLSRSRCESAIGAAVDNGRVVSADAVQCSMCSLDFEMFMDFYRYESIQILEFKVAAAGYLDPELARFILECYENKTRYKDVEDETGEAETIYRKSKSVANGIYGDFVTRLFADDTTWDPETDWGLDAMTEDKYQEKAERLKRNRPKLYKCPQLGIFVTAWGRYHLWRYLIAPLDHQVAYFDTDCVKFVGPDVNGAISSYNLMVFRMHNEIAKRLQIDPARLSPAAPDGSLHPIGCAELEQGCPYTSFRTVGAKKYAFIPSPTKKHPIPKLQITIAGVPKGCAEDLGNIDNLTDKFYFPPSNEPGKRKSILHYNDDQQPIYVGDWLMDYKHGICLQPTGYKVGLTAEYMALIIANAELYGDDLTELYNEISG